MIILIISGFVLVLKTCIFIHILSLFKFYNSLVSLYLISNITEYYSIKLKCYEPITIILTITP